MIPLVKGPQGILTLNSLVQSVIVLIYVSFATFGRHREFHTKYYFAINSSFDRFLGYKNVRLATKIIFLCR